MRTGLLVVRSKNLEVLLSYGYTSFYCHCGVRCLCDVFLVGESFFTITGVIVFRLGQRLEVEREAGNVHDSKAILLRLGGRKVGYVPRSNNSEHAMHMDAGGGVSVVITAVDMSDPWHGISIHVKNT
jgi:hypothetical protein